MIEPDDRVPAIVALPRDAERRALPVADDERTGGVEADARDARAIRIGRRQRTANRRANRRPDLLGIMLGMVGFRLVHIDRKFRAPEQTPGPIEHTGACAPGPDIHAHNEVSHHEPLFVSVMSRISPGRAVMCSKTRVGSKASSTQRWADDCA